MKLLNSLKFTKNGLKKGQCYAIHHGDYAGQMFIYINSSKNSEIVYNFLSIPVMKNISVKESDFNRGIEKGIVRFANNIPKNILKLVEKQYKHNDK